MGEILVPKDQMKTHKHAASRSQLRLAQVKAVQSVRRELISRLMRPATLTRRSEILSGLSAGIWRAATRSQASARFCPRVIKNTVPKNAISKKTPARAAKP